MQKPLNATSVKNEIMTITERFRTYYTFIKKCPFKFAKFRPQAIQKYSFILQNPI